MATATQLRKLREFNAAAVGRIPGELRALGSQLAGDRPDAIRDAFLEVVPGLADRHGQLVGAGSAEWYEAVRRSEIGGTFSARLGELPDQDVVRRNVRYAAGALFVPTEPDPMRKLTDTLVGSLSRQVLDVGRGTIRDNTNRDSRAVGWNRIAQADGCKFCIMLSSRGAVYKKQSAGFASHDNCRCSASPSWDRSAREVPVQAYRASQSTSGMSPAQKARQQRMTREWLAANEDRLDEFRAELL